MNALFVGLATYIMKNAISSCFAEKNSREPFRLQERQPFQQSWRKISEELQQKREAQRAWERLERECWELLWELEDKGLVNL